MISSLVKRSAVEGGRINIVTSDVIPSTKHDNSNPFYEENQCEELDLRYVEEVEPNMMASPHFN